MGRKKAIGHDVAERVYVLSTQLPLNLQQVQLFAEHIFPLRELKRPRQRRRSSKPNGFPNGVNSVARFLQASTVPVTLSQAAKS